MAKKSHASGERKLGQIWRSLGYGISQKASHGRPRWQIGNDRANQNRENGDGLGAASDRPAPGGVGQAQDGGDQRAGVADADPENEIGDVEGPEDGRAQSPHADAGIELITKCGHAREQQAAGERHGNPVLAAGLEERPQQVLLDLFSRSLHFARSSFEIRHVRHGAQFAE